MTPTLSDEQARRQRWRWMLPANGAVRPSMPGNENGNGTHIARICRDVSDGAWLMTSAKDMVLRPITAQEANAGGGVSTHPRQG